MIHAKDEALTQKASHRWWRCHHQSQSQSQRIVLARASRSLHFRALFAHRRSGSDADAEPRRGGAERRRRIQLVAGGGVSDATGARNQRLRF